MQKIVTAHTITIMRKAKSTDICERSS